MWRNVVFGVNVGYRARFARREKSRMAAAAALAARINGRLDNGRPGRVGEPGETVIVTATGLLSPVTAVLGWAAPS